MNRKTASGRKLTGNEITEIAREFEEREFTDDEVSNIKKSRRRAPTLGDETAEVVTFRAPPAYRDRIRARAASEHTTESRVIRDALDAYLTKAE